MPLGLSLEQIGRDFEHYHPFVHIDRIAWIGDANYPWIARVYNAGTGTWDVLIVAVPGKDGWVLIEESRIHVLVGWCTEEMEHYLKHLSARADSKAERDAAYDAEVREYTHHGTEISQ